MLWSLPFAVRAGHHPPVRAAIANWFPIQLLPRLDRFGSSNPTASPGTSGRFTVRRMFQKRPEDLQEMGDACDCSAWRSFRFAPGA